MTAGKRSTRQRAAIQQTLGRSSGFMSAQEIFDSLREQEEKVGLATVYRTLQWLVERGEVDVLQTGEGEAIYRRCGSDEHHHHLVCRSCRRSVEIESHEVEAWARGVAAGHGFTAPSHVVELFGLCEACSVGESRG